MNDGNFHSLLVGMQTGADTAEDSLAVPYNTKHAILIWSTKLKLQSLQKGTENLCLHKKTLHLNVYSGFIYNHEDLKATKMSFMDKNTAVHPDSEILFRFKK